MTFPLDAAYTKAMTSGFNRSASTTQGGITYVLTLTVTPAADASFDGSLRKKSLGTLALSQNGSILSTDSSEAYFSTGPYTLRGEVNSDGTYGVPASIDGALPAAAQVGSSGPFVSMRYYTDSSKTVVDSSATTTWSLEADTDTTAYGCLNSTLRDADGTELGKTSECYKIDTSGNILGMRYTIAEPGQTLVFQ